MMSNQQRVETTTPPKDIRDALPKDIKEVIDIDPNQDSYSTNSDRLASFRHAVGGLLNYIIYQESARLQGIITLIMVSIALTLGLSRVDMLLLTVALGLWWITEIVNAALEAVVNMVTQEYHPLAKVAKDVASSGSLIASIVLLIVVGGTMVEPLFEKLGFV